MPALRIGFCTAALLCGAAGIAMAQVGGVSGGINSDNGAMSGGAINRVNGMNANGTPRQQNPGASMTNGAGTGAMTPNVTGGATMGMASGALNGNIGLGVPKPVPPLLITHGTVSPDSSSQ